MISSLKQALRIHMKNNIKLYLLLLLGFTAGVVLGAIAINYTSNIQREELINYFMGFIDLMEKQSADSNELLKISVYENIRIVMILWVLGVSIVGIPIIYGVIILRGFVTGFSAGFLLSCVGTQGIYFAILGVLPKEILIIPCILALGVNGINFSLNIIKSRTAKSFTKGSLKTSFINYCTVTMFFTVFMLLGVLIEVYVSPILFRLIIPVLNKY